jgi:hypothetical protein
MYAVWNVDTGNLLGQYASEHDALDAVGRLIVANGLDYAGELVLARDDANGLPESIDAGESLAQRAFAASLQAASYLAGSYRHKVSIPAHPGVAVTKMTWEWTSTVTLSLKLPLDKVDALISGEYLYTDFATAPVVRGRPDEGKNQPALALAA